ncbi:hypothetical protein DEO72_LG7g1120 [Vigna unguiculata]|uniref:Uncharacterized protein n=1 Tax=Vigna unguiculata TaxID=3917 RepID=A0A4D6MJE5_VIGUN|nr:hypothetical protein DEO72_LG7g1120 [Vigna unguiculata]
MDAHNSDGGSCGGCAQQRGRTRTTAMAAVAVDRHSSEVDAHSNDGSSCGGCAQQRRRQLRWMRTAAGADAHSSGGGSCGGPAQQRGGRAQQRQWTRTVATTACGGRAQ